jgi:hypothetical protein
MDPVLHATAVNARPLPRVTGAAISDSGLVGIAVMRCHALVDILDVGGGQSPALERPLRCWRPYIGGVGLKVRCVLLGHRWNRRRIEGETTMQCRRCGRIADAGDIARSKRGMAGLGGW